MGNRYNDNEHYVEADHSPIVPYQQVLSQHDSSAVNAIQVPGSTAMSMQHSTPTAHRPQDHADAALTYSKAYMAVMFLIVSALVGVVYKMEVLGAEIFLYAVTWLGGLGIAGFVSLAVNRKQGLHHSSTGVQHHELEIRERIAEHAINTQADLMRDRWGIDSNE